MLLDLGHQRRPAAEAGHAGAANVLALQLRSDQGARIHDRPAIGDQLIYRLQCAQAAVRFVFEVLGHCFVPLPGGGDAVRAGLPGCGRGCYRRSGLRRQSYRRLHFHREAGDRKDALLTPTDGAGLKWPLFAVGTDFDRALGLAQGTGQ